MAAQVHVGDSNELLSLPFPAAFVNPYPLRSPLPPFTLEKSSPHSELEVLLELMNRTCSVLVGFSLARERRFGDVGSERTLRVGPFYEIPYLLFRL